MLFMTSSFLSYIAGHALLLIYIAFFLLVFAMLSMQTLLLDDELMLCDCPGLVFPQFVSTKAEMVCSGILPIDQMRDHEGPVNHVCHKIPRFILQKLYGIMLPKPAEGEDPDRPPVPLELLMSYGCKLSMLLMICDAS